MYEWTKSRRHYPPENKVKYYMYQLLKSIDHMHRNGIYHRDIKPENVLLIDDVLKLADFGSCRGIYSKQPYTEYISTRWYRAPECLLTDGYYNYKMDIWGVGCVFFEILAFVPLFPGKNELDQIHQIHNVLGTPPVEILEEFQKKASHMEFNFPPKQGTGIDNLIPHASPEAKELIYKMLAYQSEDRLSARQALKHAFFKDLRDQDKPLRVLQNPSPTSIRSNEPDNAAGEETKGKSKEDISALPPIKNPGPPTKPQKKKVYEPNSMKSNLSNKSITLDTKNLPMHYKKLALETRKSYLSPYAKKTFYKSYY